MKLLRLFLGLTLVALTNQVFATSCTAYPDPIISLPAGNFTLPVDRWEPGVQLSPASVQQGIAVLSCDIGAIHSPYDVWVQGLLADSGVKWEAFGQTFTVFESGVPGVGYAIALRFDGASSWMALSPGEKCIRCGFATNWSGQMQLAVWFIATGSAPVGVQSTPKTRILKMWSWISFNGQRTTGYVAVAANEFVVETMGCELLDGDIDVDMGVVSAAKQLHAIGDSTAAKAISIPINCDGEVAVDMSIASVGSPDAGLGILPLKAGSASAGGVGIQMLRADGVTPIPLGVDVRVSDKTVIGRNDIPLAARYYQTAEEVTPGRAGALAEFTLKYR